MSADVRVRFAPSPTGPLHIGGVRTALFNYLFAKKHNGTFILRIEDTDQNRYVEGAEDYIVESLNWCNIPYDEGPGKDGVYGPYRQSERKNRYKKYALQLIENGAAYYAFDTPEELATARENAEANKETFIYNHHNRLNFTNSLTLTESEVQERMDRGDDYVIRFKPEIKTLFIFDEIRKGIEIDTSLLDDKVLFKSDGMPTYHLANIVDDHEMKISHVIRGEEWLPSMALHVLLYESLNWDAPKFAHLPLILKPTGKGKLSKRDGDKMGFPVFPLEWNPENGEKSSGYREDGYLPEAVVNMLAFLGWNPGTEQEIFTLDELVQSFSLDHVNNSGAKFDPEKTKWFQQQWFVQQDDAVVGTAFAKALQAKGIEYGSEEFVNIVVGLVKERAVFVEDLFELAGFFFTAPIEFDEKAASKSWKEDTADIMNNMIAVIQKTEDDSAVGLSDAVKGWIKEQEMGFGKVMMPLRLSLVGSLMGPDVFEIASLIGKQETVRRIQFAIEKLG
ncbi:glutamate--tRNA ligase [Nonlabens marinus]|uniref:Glutamate--tRNA ligase n=1 Tax=Nonlabens marinus S1-08 TaxID=1454201 RepID=W8VUR9_9FLAO|nr:glutamate--tRNA ligase [Nonlabens marinus]BAO54838.1 glutamyl-tRNA synthetase [Nonlabens marinus S1-08]